MLDRLTVMVADGLTHHPIQQNLCLGSGISSLPTPPSSWGFISSSPDISCQGVSTCRAQSCLCRRNCCDWECPCSSWVPYLAIINGSPRKKGLISQMLGIMQQEAESKGNKTQTVYTNNLNIKPCIGCMSCRTKEKCVLGEDDSQRVLKMMQEADAIIMGAPCYWGNIPGQMKLLFDRIVYGMMRDTPRFPEPLMKGKKCILISTCTTPWPWNILFKQSRGAIRAMREICRYSGFKIVTTIERGGTAMHPQLSEKDKQKCLKAVQKEAAAKYKKHR